MIVRHLLVVYMGISSAISIVQRNGYQRMQQNGYQHKQRYQTVPSIATLAAVPELELVRPVHNLRQPDAGRYIVFVK